MKKIETKGSKKMKQGIWAFFIIFLVSCFITVPKVQSSTQSEPVSQKQSLIELNEDNWRQMFEGEWMVEFFAPWCPACKSLAPAWERFASSASDFNVNVAKIDVTTSPSLSGRFYVTALPTIYHVKDGEFRQYRGTRNVIFLMNFIKQKQWKELEPISSWKKPDTLHMSVLSYFFKLSHTLKNLNIHLQEEYGVPSWGSYALFTIATIFVGAALGLMLVCVVDFVYPPKKLQRQSFSESRENSRNDIEDMAIDEIEDDRIQDADDDGEDYEEEAVDEDEDEDNENETVSTEDEKQTQSESEEPESEKKSEKQPDIKTSPSEVRKRKPRKAD